MSQSSWPPSGSYHCYFCKTFVALNSADMLNHWHQKNPCVCAVKGCGLQLACWGLFTLHMRNVHHSEGPPGPGDTRCTDCNNHFSSGQLYQMHRGHTACPRDGCPFTAQCSTAVYQHQATAHLPRKT